MKCFLFACLILATATVAEAGHNGNLRIVRINGQNFAVDNCGNAQRLGRGNNFNRNRFRSNRGRLNSGGFGGQRNVNFGLINFN
jgi:hypothetical protein